MSGRRRQNTRRRNPAPAPGRAAPPRPTRNRWWNRATKSIVTVIVTLGTVAGAVSTIISLWPTPDSDDSADVTVRIIPGIPLSEYQHRIESTSAISLKGYSPPADETTTEGRARTEPSEATSPLQTTSADPSETPASSTPDAEPTTNPTSTLTAEPPAHRTSTSTANPTTSPTDSPTATEFVVIDPPDTGAGDVADIEDAYENLTGEASPSDFIAIGNAVSPGGVPVEPAVAAEQIAKVLKEARQAPSSADPTILDPEPLGVVVSADLDLSGLRDRTLTLSWSMWQEGGRIRLSGDWLNDNLAYRITPRTDHATTTLDVWIPMPREPGSYFVRVDLRNGPTRVDSGESERFE